MQPRSVSLCWAHIPNKSSLSLTFVCFSFAAFGTLAVKVGFARMKTRRWMASGTRVNRVQLRGNLFKVAHHSVQDPTFHGVKVLAEPLAGGAVGGPPLRALQLTRNGIQLFDASERRISRRTGVAGLQGCEWGRACWWPKRLWATCCDTTTTIFTLAHRVPPATELEHEATAAQTVHGHRPPLHVAHAPLCKPRCCCDLRSWMNTCIHQQLSKRICAQRPPHNGLPTTCLARRVEVSGPNEVWTALTRGRGGTRQAALSSAATASQ